MIDDDNTLSSDISSISTDFSINDSSMTHKPLIEKESVASYKKLPVTKSEDCSKISDSDISLKRGKTL